MNLDFGDPTPKELPVKLGEKKYTLREASSDAVVKWRNAILASHVYKDGEMVGMKGTADAEPLLVSSCLWDEHGLNPSEAEVRSWPNRITKKLFITVKQISDLAEMVPPERPLLAELLDLPELIEKTRKAGKQFEPLLLWLTAGAEGNAKN